MCDARRWIVAKLIITTLRVVRTPMSMGTDLFGEPLQSPDWTERWLAEHDAATFAERHRRLRQTIDIFPDGYFMMPMESHAVFTEARSTYVNGDFASVLMVAQAYVEHRLQGYLSSQGQSKVANSGLARMLEYCRQHELLGAFILKGLDHLRLIRNPFTHLRPFDDPHSLAQRTLEQRMHPADLMEREAYRAFALMLTVAVSRLPNEL